MFSFGSVNIPYSQGYCIYKASLSLSQLTGPAIFICGRLPYEHLGFKEDTKAKMHVEISEAKESLIMDWKEGRQQSVKCIPTPLSRAILPPTLRIED